MPLPPKCSGQAWPALQSQLITKVGDGEGRREMKGGGVTDLHTSFQMESVEKGFKDGEKCPFFSVFPSHEKSNKATPGFHLM